MDTVSSRTTTTSTKARVQRGLNRVLGDGAARAKLNTALRRANFELIVRGPEDVWEAEFAAFYASCEPYTMTSKERMYALYQATHHIVRAEVPGDIVECGVWRGGSSMMAGMTLRAAGDAHRRMWLYDTFEGMSEPTEKDVDVNGVSARKEWEDSQKGDINEWCFSPIDEVRQNMRATGLDEGRFSYVKGMVEETLPDSKPEQIALLRLDTDWYESSYAELEHLYPLLSPGGVLIIDDYGQWAGQRDAVDQYFTENGIHMLLNRIDYASRIGIKSAG